jgi:cell division protein FtsW
MNLLALPLLLAFVTLLLLGVVMLNSATVTQVVPRRLYCHLAWLGLGLGSAVLMALADYRRLQKRCLPLLLLGMAALALALVLIPGLGLQINGARRWLPSGGQPSEFAKLALILFLAGYGAQHQQRMAEIRIGFIRPAVVCGLPILLIFLEPDWGTAGLAVTVCLAMLLIAGARWIHVLLASTAALISFSVLLQYNPLRLARWTSFLDPEEYQTGIGWQAWHSLLSIGRGGLWGTSLGEGSHKYGFVPEQQTDFIFSLIGEELGFVGTTFVILMFATVVVSGLRIVWRISDTFGQLLAAGLTLLIGLQAAMNIGVCTSTLPNKGIALPFVSYGGSSLVSMLTAAGLLISVAQHAPRPPTHNRSKAPSTNSSPFQPPRCQPHRESATELAGILLRRKLTTRGRVLSWFRKRHRARASGPVLHRYQRPPIRTHSV